MLPAAHWMCVRNNHTNWLADGLWIFGLAWGLAVVSFAVWNAQDSGLPWIIWWKTHPLYTVLLCAAGICAAAGLAWNTPSGWRRVVWIVVSVLCLAEGIWLEVARRRRISP